MVQSPLTILEVVQTSAAGDQQRRLGEHEYRVDNSSECHAAIDIFPDQKKQTLLGIGSSITEASAFVLAHLECEQRSELMQQLFGEQGANFSMGRVPVGSSDFSVEGCFSYAQTPHDYALDCFDIAADFDGFDPLIYSGVQDSSFDVLPMIKQALSIKAQQSDQHLKLIASAWTAPPWMKDNADWFTRANADNGFQGTGGELLPEHYATYADYLNRYLDAYRAQGVDIWGLTPVNEPLGNNGQWESMHFSAQTQNVFIKNYLGPRLQQGSNRDVALLIFDHNRKDLEAWCDVILADSETARYVTGSAVHWYDSSNQVYADVFDRVLEKFPDKLIIHSEGCVDNLGNDAPEGVLDPAGYKESGWFGNDDFWWNDNATDYGYTATWPGVNALDHPAYAPVHRYVRDIIAGVNHGLSGWIDWNCVLDSRGGPNHVGNYCGAPVMVDTASGFIYYTPVFHVLAQLSRSIRSGDVAVSCVVDEKCLPSDVFHACAAVDKVGRIHLQVFNRGTSALTYRVRLNKGMAAVTIPPNALQTLCLQEVL